MAHHPVRHQHRRRPPGRPGITPPATRPRRRPHPRAQRHRPDQPTAAGLRQEPDLAGDHRPGCRPAGLDPDAGLARPGRPPLGTQTAPTPAADRRWAHHPQRPPTATTAAPRLALERPHRHRLGSPPTRLTQPPRPHDQGPRRPGEHSADGHPCAAAALPQVLPERRSSRLTPQPHERSRLSPDFRGRRQHPDLHHRRSEPVFVSKATHSTWCVIGNRSNARSPTSR